jgi:DNA repair protein RadC
MPSPSSTQHEPHRAPPEAVHGPLIARPPGPSDLDLLEALLEPDDRPDRAGPGKGRPGGARRRAVSLLDRYGDLRALSAADADQLVAEEALSSTEAHRVAAGLALGRRAAALPLRRGEKLSRSADIHAAYGPRLKDLPREVLLAVHLDTKGRVQREERVSEGSLTGSPCNPREVFGPALRQGAAGLILIHNHPSGDPEPSSLDVDVTRRMVSAGEILGVSLLDHVVIGADRFVSLLERGVIPRGG